MAVSPSVDRLVKPDAPRDAIPPLVDGERLTRDEFERRFDAMPGLKKEYPTKIEEDEAETDTEDQAP